MIDWTKPVRTKGSKTPVTILSTKGPGNMCIVGYVDNGDTDVYQWGQGGGFNPEPVASDMDLENIPERACPQEIFDAFKQGWESFDENRYKRDCGKPHDSMTRAFTKSACYSENRGRKLVPQDNGDTLKIKAD